MRDDPDIFSECEREVIRQTAIEQARADVIAQRIEDCERSEASYWLRKPVELERDVA